MLRLISLLLAIGLFSACCKQDPFSAGHKVIGFEYN